MQYKATIESLVKKWGGDKEVVVTETGGVPGGRVIRRKLMDLIGSKRVRKVYIPFKEAKYYNVDGDIRTVCGVNYCIFSPSQP